MSADRQSPQEYVGMARQMASICPSIPMHTCFMGLPSLLFSVHWHTVSIHSCCIFPLSHIQQHSKFSFLGFVRKVGMPTWLQSDREPSQVFQNARLIRSRGKGKPADWNGKFKPQGFSGKSPHPLKGVVFCRKNLPYPICNLL